MATQELTLTPDQIASILIVLNAVERLPMLSENILEDVAEGEAYETLCRQLRTLHDNLVEISEMATTAKTYKEAI